MNEQLEQLENQLEDMSKSKRIAIYIVILIALVYTSWNIFGEDMSLKIQTKEDTIAALYTKLQKNSTKSIEKAFKKAKHRSLVLEEEDANLHFKNQFIKNKLESIGFIYYSEQGMAKLLDSTLKSSLKNRIDIKTIESSFQSLNYLPYIFEKEQLHIEGSGNFPDIMSLIQYIDSLHALLRINSITIDIDDKEATNFNLNISQYGVEL